MVERTLVMIAGYIGDFGGACAWPLWLQLCKAFKNICITIIITW